MTERLKLRLSIYGVTCEADLASCTREIASMEGVEVRSTALSGGDGLLVGLVDVMVDDAHLFLRDARAQDWFDRASVQHMGSVPNLPVPQPMLSQAATEYREHKVYRRQIPRRWYA